MTIRVDKTEREFREAFAAAAQVPNELFTDQECERLVDAIKAALDLEFREEEGEGLPEILGSTEVRGGAFGLTDGEGNILGDIGLCGAKLSEAALARVLFKALGRYNDYPALETLARELGEIVELVLSWSDGPYRFSPEARHAARKFLSRLRELLGEEGE